MSIYLEGRQGWYFHYEAVIEALEFNLMCNWDSLPRKARIWRGVEACDAKTFGP